MADTNTVVHIGENSSEYIAYRLMRDIARIEVKLLDPSAKNPQKVVDRKWILDTFAECIRTVRAPSAPSAPSSRGAAAMIKDS